VSDVVVIGATADGLVAAQLLVRDRHRVTVVAEEAAPALGAWLPAQVMRALGIGDARLGRPDPWLRAPLDDGTALELWSDMGRSVASIRRVSPRDAENWPRFCERIGTLAALLERIYLEPAPSLVDLRFALRVRRLGRQAMEDLMRTLPMPAAELLDDWFESDVLKGALGAFAVRDLHQGPRSAGTAFRLLHEHVGNPRGVFRRATADLAARLRAAVNIRDARVSRIAVRAAHVTGVLLNGGEELPASLVVSSLEPRRTLVDLVEPGWLDPELARAVRQIRNGAVAANYAVELERAPAWTTLTLAPSLDYVERAYDDVKYGRVSAHPWIDALADGKRLHVHLQYAPHGEANGDGRLAELLAPHVPAIVACKPVASQAGQAELTLDQALWMRPIPELARYRTPITGLWLCGPAMHPGIAGICGYNCAREIMRSA
jgi:phytoene dehydrogenase-like protein